MSLHTDEQFLAAVAAALGETIALVRRRGFHLEPTAANGDPRPAQSCSPCRPDDDDVLDLSVHSIDWDAADDSRLNRRPRRRIVRRRRSVMGLVGYPSRPRQRCFYSPQGNCNDHKTNGSLCHRWRYDERSRRRGTSSRRQGTGRVDRPPREARADERGTRHYRDRADVTVDPWQKVPQATTHRDYRPRSTMSSNGSAI